MQLSTRLMGNWTNRQMKNFSIITNVAKDENLTMTNAITSYIENKGGSVCLLSTYEGRKPGRDFRADQIPDGTECIIVLGGDGTLIRAATKVENLAIPMIGVNLGNLGYLCELEKTNVYRAIDRLLADEYMLEERMMLTGYKAGHENSRSALNDIVIHQVGGLSILHLNVYVNGEFLSTYLADGIIVATPTGSTGYNMSAGGPIVDPKAKMLLLTPINAHNLRSRSIVLGAEDVVEIEIASRRPEQDEQAVVSFDGDSVLTLGVGDRFVVSQASSITRICKLNKESFLEIMRRKMENYQ